MGDAGDVTAAPVRADVALVSRGLARSRAQARELIQAQAVTLDGGVLRKASEKVSADQELTVEVAPDPWVGRAAYKLLGAFEAFAGLAQAVDGARCIDVGASTGGFTQVLLSRGAATVLALDVGHDQLVDELSQDPRVTDLPGTNVRDVDVAGLGGPADVVVADLSFISLPLVMARLAHMTVVDGHLMVLVKPQFEVGRNALARTGVVQSPQLRARSVSGAVDSARQHGLVPHGLAQSPVAGGTGNVEYLLWLRHETTGMMTAMDLNAALEQIAQGAS